MGKDIAPPVRHRPVQGEQGGQFPQRPGQIIRNLH